MCRGKAKRYEQKLWLALKGLCACETIMRAYGRMQNAQEQLLQAYVGTHPRYTQPDGWKRVQRGPKPGRCEMGKDNSKGAQGRR
jgi:hypothetical protein